MSPDVSPVEVSRDPRTGLSTPGPRATAPAVRTEELAAFADSETALPEAPHDGTPRGVPRRVNGVLEGVGEGCRA
ncbi:hypothetical protein [Streptomyces macrosporus]|uniref:Uncharacterized protein n=1 Tax=Streptomyces macrosporus TaxID=44032 RepID=A0ABP5WG18_9ACTN